MKGTAAADYFQAFFQTLRGILSADDAFGRRTENRAEKRVARVFYRIGQSGIRQRKSPVLQNLEPADPVSGPARHENFEPAADAVCFVLRSARRFLFRVLFLHGVAGDGEGHHAC